jgi:hypothetical protein
MDEKQEPLKAELQTKAPSPLRSAGALHMLPGLIHRGGFCAPILSEGIIGVGETVKESQHRHFETCATSTNPASIRPLPL